MKEIISKINKVFENKVRLGIMSALAVNDTLDFKALKELLGVTDGNLSSNISVLEKKKYIIVRKKFIDKKSNTSFSITKAGEKAFKDHIDVLEELVKEHKIPSSDLR
ncbi:MAG: transcriptional regulator [Desulfobacterales bacterium]|nr:transcriptional regulator [Desulfobacterales bacterium]